jgi:hypothetical protein
MRKRIFYILPILFCLILALPAFAQQPNPAPFLFVSFRSNDFGTVIAAITRAVLGLIGIVSVVYVIWGGFQYLTSGMNSDLAERGKKTLRYAVTGLIIAILSYIIVTVVVNSLVEV